MTKVTLLCWQEIPSLVEARGEGKTHKVELSFRFQELIDLIAMKRGLDGSDTYLMQWKKEKQPESDQNAKSAAEGLAAEIEQRFNQIKADAIANYR